MTSDFYKTTNNLRKLKPKQSHDEPISNLPKNALAIATLLLSFPSPNQRVPWYPKPWLSMEKDQVYIYIYDAKRPRMYNYK